jgi:hypothetical protein
MLPFAEQLLEAEARRKAAGRQCGACSMCCYVLGVDEPPLVKPPDKWCPHCAPGNGGCLVYANRPVRCQAFYCAWLVDKSFSDYWYPLTAKIVINLTCNEDGTNACWIFEVDPRRPDRWLQEPWFSDVCRIAVMNPGTTVRVGRRWFILVPSAAAANPSRIDVTARIPAARGEDSPTETAKVIPGKVGKPFHAMTKNSANSFEWIEIAPTQEFAERGWRNDWRPQQ